MEPKPKAHLFTFAVMALFIFVFLGSEYHFDIAYGELAGPDSVVGAQASILATSAIGLVGYSLVNRTAAARHRSILAGVLGTVSALLLVATQLTQNANALLSLGCLLFLILGMLGNATYFSVAQTHYASNSLSRLVGTSYAAGLLAQFLLHSLAPNSVIEAAIIGASIIALGFALAARRNVLHVAPRQKRTSRKRPANRQRTRCPQGSNPAARLRIPNCLRFQHTRQRGYPGKRARHVRPFNLASPASCRQRHCGWLHLRPH